MDGSTMMLAFLQNLGLTEMLVIGGIALLLFGRRLPEVGRSLGRGIVEFKKGLREVEDEVDHASDAPRTPAAPKDNRENPPASHGGG